MTKIKISIKAYGYVDNNYKGKEITQNSFIEKDLTSFLLTEKDLRLILETLIISIKKTKTLYPDEQTNVIYHNNNRLESIKFDIIFDDELGDSQIIEEKAFFEQAAKYDNLSSLILKYCEVTDDGAEGTRIWGMSEYDEGPPAGTYAILALVNQSKNWISNYIDFLRTNDLDHEVEQIWDIQSIIEKYGWGKETCRLAIARNVSCCGQGGKEQFNNFLNNGLIDYLNSDEHRKEFLNLILQEFREWDQIYFRLKKGFKQHYIDYIINYVQHFNRVLENKEINEIETYLLSKWEDYKS
ncbi:MAG TPA: hypothetical protein DCS93_11225 [Microscillaceae bacterium]|nr:hypothetical protein [Microscillaceae bacterium]